MSEPFSVPRFLDELRRRGDAATRVVLSHEEIGSTSSALAERLAAGAGPGTTVIAERQLEGRGRSGRSWHSPGAGSLYLSVAVGAPGGVDELLTMVPLAAGVAAADALGELGIGGARLKWPNDVLLEERKLAGILCEVPDPRQRPLVAIVGIGVNLGRAGFPGELEGVATSAAEHLGEVAPREPVAAAWVAGLERWTARVGREGAAPLVEAWRARAEPFGRRVRVGALTGVTVDLNAGGHLVIQQDDGSKVEVSGGIVENL